MYVGSRYHHINTWPPCFSSSSLKATDIINNHVNNLHSQKPYIQSRLLKRTIKRKKQYNTEREKMAAKAVVCYGSSTSSTTLRPVLCPQQLNKRRGVFAVNSRRCSININHKSLSFRPKTSLRWNLEATGIPTSVPVRVAHELHQAGHRYLDVRTPDEFSAGHAAGAINIPYMYKVGSGMTKNPKFVEEVSSHFRKHDEIIVGCQLGKRSMMAATDLLAAGFTAVTDIAGGFAAWTQNGLPTDN